MAYRLSASAVHPSRTRAEYTYVCKFILILREGRKHDCLDFQQFILIFQHTGSTASKAPRGGSKGSILRPGSNPTASTSFRRDNASATICSLPGMCSTWMSSLFAIMTSTADLRMGL